MKMGNRQQASGNAKIAGYIGVGIALCAALVSLKPSAHAQQPAKVHRVDFLWFARMEQGQSRREAFGAGDARTRLRYRQESGN